MSTPPRTALADSARTSSLDSDSSGPLLAAPAPEGGRLVLGRYALLGLHRRGGQAQILRAVDLVLEREVAVKRLLLHAAEAPGWRAQATRREGRLNASIQHPAILPVFDVGEDEALGPILIMPMVPGAYTLHELLELRAAGHPPPWCSPHLLLEVLAQLCDALAHLHENGLLHGDVHPGNVLVGWGPSGARVQLIDFGLAQRVGPDPALQRGVPGQIAPELLSGAATCSPRLDVYALGALIFHVIYGVSPRRLWRGGGPGAAPTQVDPALAALISACMASDPLERPATARVVHRALQDHLALLAARARADALLAGVSSDIAVADGLHLRQLQLLGEVDRLRAKLSPGPAAESPALAAVWAKEDEARALAADMLRLHAAIEGAFQSALGLVPGHPPAVEALGKWLVGRHRAAEQGRDPSAKVIEARLEALARPELAAYLRGIGRAEVHFGDALRWSISPLSASSGRIVRPGPPLAEGEGWQVARDLPHGSYVLQLQRPGEARAHVYPFVVPRAGLHRVEDRERRPAVIDVPLAATLGDDEVWVPPGWHYVGGDPRALGGTQPVAVEVFTPGFACAKAPVTVRAYGVFLQHLRKQGVDVSEALPYPTRRGPEVSPLRFGPDDALTLAPDWDGHHWSLDWPICVIGLEQAEAYAAWIGAQRGGVARLPTEHEWERMVRGADRRLYPWGDHCEVGWAWTQEVWAPTRLACPAPVGAHPVDVSVFGVLDAVGNVASFTRDPPEADPDAPVRVRGGSWLSGLTQLRIGSRLTVPRRARPASVGLRWVRALPGAAPDLGGAVGPAEGQAAAP